MKRLLSSCLVTLVLTATPGLVPQASADHNDWVFGTAFRVGNFFFRIGFQPDAYHRHGDYFIRIREPLSYRNYSCSRACYRDRTHYYHHRSCPVVQHYFNHYGNYDYTVNHYFPRSNYGYRGDNGYYRDHGRGYYRDHGYHRGYGYKRGYRHHRHTPSCGHHY